MKLKDIIKGIFFPRRCEICGNIKPLTMPFCEKCGIDTDSISASACPDCGHEKCMCDSGANIHLPHFTAVYYYQGQIKSSLLAFKFSGDSVYGDIFGKAMAQRITELYGDITFDGVCFVPMTKKAERIRGYNQSELLASKISSELSTELLHCLVKTRNSHSQKSLNSSERYENIKDSFALAKGCDIKGKTLILCDDIKTTGSTLRECCDTLLKHGAKEVYCVCLALTPYLKYTDLF